MKKGENKAEFLAIAKIYANLIEPVAGETYSETAKRLSDTVGERIQPAVFRLAVDLIRSKKTEEVAVTPFIQNVILSAIIIIMVGVMLARLVLFLFGVDNELALPLCVFSGLLLVYATLKKIIIPIRKFSRNSPTH